VNSAIALAEAAPRRWSTDAVHPARRLDYWVGAICEAFLEMDCSSREAGAFAGTLTSLPADGVSINQVLASTQDVYRTPAAIARSRQQPFYLITQLRSPWHVRQGGHVAHLRPGDAVLVDAAQTYELHFPDSVAALSIQMPRPWIGRWLAEMESSAPRVVARDRGWGRSLSALCTQLGEEPALAAGYPASLLSDQIGAMLAAALEPVIDAPAAASQALVTRAETLLRARLDEPGLGATSVAAGLSVSVRTLHRAFASRGTTFAASLRRIRIDHAAQLLAQPRLSHVSVAELGRRSGFEDASHFVRQFRLAWGQTPARWRSERAGT
jgi:AraC family transcriptional regulator, positive regulator of tynA and feaB